MGRNDRLMEGIQSALGMLVITLAIFLTIAVGSVLAAYFLPLDLNDRSTYER